jgi:hypothetical protein
MDPYLQDIIQRLEVLERQEENKCHTLEQISTSLQSIRTDTANMKEILDVWNSAKGFIKTVHFLAEMGKIFWFPIAVLIAVYYFGRTGHWTLK